MREGMGLYRGKMLQNGKWAEGSLLKVTIEGKPFYLIFGDSFSWDGKDAHAYSHAIVDPSTVGQYTGLTDKNGKRIFEGDVLFDPHPHVQERYEVIWFGGGFMRRTRNGHYLTLSPLNCGDFEVIGNVTDNPELLDGGET